MAAILRKGQILWIKNRTNKLSLQKEFSIFRKNPTYFVFLCVEEERVKISNQSEKNCKSNRARKFEKVRFS